MTTDSLDVAVGVLEALQDQNASRQQQSLSTTTIEACSRASSQLKALKLDSQERKVISHLSDIDAAEHFISRYLAVYEEAGLAKKGWKKVYAVSRFAGPVLEVFKQANFSVECSIALGLVGLLLIQPLNTKSEIEERLEAEMNQLTDILSQARFSQSMTGSVQIANEVDGLCASVIDFLIHALYYQKKSSLIKMLSAIILDYSRRFQSFVDKIRHHAAKIERLAQQSYSTILINSNDLLNHTASTTDDLRKWALAHTSEFNSKVARLEASVASFQISITELRTHEALKYIHEIEAIISPTGSESSYALLRLKGRLQDLAPKEQWQKFASDIQFPEWARTSKPPIFWIGGAANVRGVCWVSSLALDIIEALEAERGIDLAYVFGDRGREYGVISALAIFNLAIVQLLKARPEIVFQRRFMDLLPLSVFQEAHHSVSVSFEALANLITILSEESLKDDRKIFFIIDRVDLCSALASESEGKQFLQSLLRLNEAMPQLRIIITSNTPAPELPALVKGRQNFADVWVNPHKPVAMSSR